MICREKSHDKERKMKAKYVSDKVHRLARESALL